jgi:xanthine dehydrogenase molybdopterin-binding subunit B
MPQLVSAYESHTDLVARQLGLDPVEFRRKNLLKDGLPQATGTVLKDTAIVAVLDRIAQRIGWGQPFDQGSGSLKRGRGIVIGMKASISPTTSVATIAVAADGSATLYCGTVDMGQGSTTALAQIAAEALGIEVEAVRVVAPDTDVTPYDMGTLGSRSTFHTRSARARHRDRNAICDRTVANTGPAVDFSGAKCYVPPPMKPVSPMWTRPCLREQSTLFVLRACGRIAANRRDPHRRGGVPPG